SEVRAGRFRQDVYYRLNEFLIVLPPLRVRDDLLELANDFVAEASAELGRPCRGISSAAAERLLRHSWPGNVRELRNVIRRAIVLASDVIEPIHLTSLGRSTSLTTAVEEKSAPIGPSLKEIAETAAAEAEQRAIRRTLQSTRG